MLSSKKFIQQSLELHLFFARIMKEHSFFLQVGFTPENLGYIDKADAFRMEFDNLLCDTVSLSDGLISSDVLQSGEIVTPFTFEAEQISSYFTGVRIPTKITRAEQRLIKDSSIREKDISLEQKVIILNDRAMELTKGLAQFKERLLSDVISRRLFTANYPLHIYHVLKEAKSYLRLIQKLQDCEEIDIEKKVYQQESFWNSIMGEHSKFICGLLDPTENKLINMANNFAQEFDELKRESKEAMNKPMSISKLTKESFKATAAISKFKEEGTQGLLECKIKSIIMPLLGDHTLREANYYLRLLKIFKRSREID